MQLFKQSVEMLDTVREQAARQLSRLLPVRQIVSEYAQSKHIVASANHTDSQIYRQELQSWTQINTALLSVLSQLPHFEDKARLLILSGIVTSTGSPPEVFQRAAPLLFDWVKTLPQAGLEGSYTIDRLAIDLLNIVKDTKQSNRIIVPALNTLAALLEQQEGTLLDLQESSVRSIASTAADLERQSRVKVKKEAARRLYVFVISQTLNFAEVDV